MGRRGVRGWAAAWVAALVCALPCDPAAALHGPGKAQFAGHPPVERFTPSIDIYPQHYAVIEDAQGRVLLGSNDGLVEFDSERWRLTRMPNGELVRSLALAPDGTIYIGSYNLFGLMRRNATGMLVFEDLTPKFKSFFGDREIADIWEVRLAPEGVYFRALYDLFLWDPKTSKVEHWHHPGRFGWISAHHGKTSVQFRGEGVKVRNNGAWNILPDGPKFKVLMQMWLPLAGQRTLAVDSEGAWWLVNAIGRAEPLARPRGIDPNMSLVSGIVLADGDIALSTVSGDVYFLDAALKDARRVNLDSGFVIGLAAQKSGGVLATVHGSLFRIGWPAQWSIIGQGNGVNGSFSALVPWNGDFYLLATGGMYRAKKGAGEVRFERLPIRTDTPQHLFPLDARRALLADARHMALIEDGRARIITPETLYPREFVRSRFHKDRVFLFTEHGLRTIDLARNLAVSPPLPDKDGLLVSTIVEVSPTEAWAGTQRHGVLRYTLKENGDLASVTEMGASSGLQFGQIAEAYVSEIGPRDSQGKPVWVVSTTKGNFRWDGRQFVPESLGNLSAIRRPDEAFVFVQRANGDLWAYGNTRIMGRAAGTTEWRKQEVHPLLRGALVHHTELGDDHLAFVTSDGLLIHHPEHQWAAAQDPARSPHALFMSGVTLEQGGKSTPLPLVPDAPVRIPEGEFSLRFEFAMPQLVREGVKQYQGQLVGNEGAMSDWGQPSRYTYYALQAGDYAMKIRGRDADGRIAEMPDYPFEVVPPWYSSKWARAAYLIGAMILAAIMVLLYVRRRMENVQRANLALEEGIAVRTRELADANRRLDMMAHMDGLTGIANRRSLDAYLPAVWTQCREQRRPVSVLIIDADHFKQYNDTHGHVSGDDLLKSLTRHLLNQLRRAEDFLARYGGEEFVVVLPGADSAVAAAMAESMRKSISESPLGITVSIGTCTAVPDGEPPEALVARADRALYEAKRGGRNRVEVCEGC